MGAYERYGGAYVHIQVAYDAYVQKNFEGVEYHIPTKIATGAYETVIGAYEKYTVAYQC